MRWTRELLRWAVLLAVTAGVTVPLTMVGVPSAALFDQLEQLVQRTTPMRNEDKRLVIDSFQRAFELEPLRLSRG